MDSHLNISPKVADDMAVGDLQQDCEALAYSWLFVNGIHIGLEPIWGFSDFARANADVDSYRQVIMARR